MLYLFLYNMRGFYIVPKERLRDYLKNLAHINIKTSRYYESGYNEDEVFDEENN